MKVSFVGSGLFALNVLKFLEDFPFCAVITQPPKPKGRGLRLAPTPVGSWARERQVRLIEAERLEGEEITSAFGVDLVLVVDYGRKIPAGLLGLPKHGCFNLHPSILPRYRGAAPVQRAIMEGASFSGVTLFKLVDKMDAGPIFGTRPVEIRMLDTLQELYVRMAFEGSVLFRELVRTVREGLPIVLRDQEEGLASYAPKISEGERVLSFEQDCLKFHNSCRALSPEPGAFFGYKGKCVKVLSTKPEPCARGEGVGEVLEMRDGGLLVSCSQGGVWLLRVCEECRSPISGEAWARGKRIKKGDRLC